MKKYWGVLIGVLVLVALIWIFAGNSLEGSNAEVNSLSEVVVPSFQGEGFAVKTEESFLEFEGQSFTGSPHVGTFQNWEANVYLNGEDLTGFEGTAYVESIATDNSRLDDHLKGDDFFDLQNYPEINFFSTEVDLENNEATGILNFHGESKEIVFPIILGENKISSEVILDVTEFNFKYAGVKPEVRISFDLVY